MTKELIGTLAPKVVTKIQGRSRLLSAKDSQGDPSPQMFLNFTSSAKRLYCLNLGSFKCVVRSIAGAPPRCNARQRYGPTSIHRISKLNKWFICSGERYCKESPSEASPKCANREGGHQATNSHCVKTRDHREC